MFEDEAELGSDDEEHDDVRKKIDREGDEEEDEDGLDEDLEGFVVHEGDDADVGDADEAAFDKYQRDMEDQEREYL